MPQSKHSERLQNLQASLGKPEAQAWLSNSQLSFERLTLLAYSQDLWPRKLLQLREEGPLEEPRVDLVLWPESTQQLVEMIEWVKLTPAILIPYGAGSGVCGATIPPETEARPREIGRAHV
jgi:FAD/FMN-containing dehydrogenase